MKQAIDKYGCRFRYGHDFYPADTLELVLQGPQYLFTQAERTGVKLPPEQHRLMIMGHGIQDPSNYWVKSYAAMCKQKNW